MNFWFQFLGSACCMLVGLLIDSSFFVNFFGAFCVGTGLVEMLKGPLA